MTRARFRAAILAVWLAAASCLPAGAQSGFAASRLDVAQSIVRALPSGDVVAEIALTQGVPFRTHALSGPARVVVDLRDTAAGGFDPQALIATERVTGARIGLHRPGWTRLVLSLDRPMRIHGSSMRTDADSGAAKIVIRLTETDAATLPNHPPQLAEDDTPRVVVPAGPDRPPLGQRPTVVMIDPGHGGFDPGAQTAEIDEADLMLTFARELKEVLDLTGTIEAHLTRSEDIFVPLETRMVLARRVGADILLSLHADALQEGIATGTTVYTLSARASDSASRELAETLNRSDLLGGADLTYSEDDVAIALMEIARPDTAVQSEALGAALVEGIGAATGRMRNRPRLSAGFEILKAPDFASVLIELGFITSPADLANLTNPDWRAKVAKGIAAAIEDWTRTEAARRQLARQ